MARYRFAERAALDLDEIWVNIATDNIEAADRVIEQIHHTASLLAANTKMGRARPELIAELRSFPTQTPYILYYIVEKGEGLAIVRVLHHARDVELAFFGEVDTE
jgi:plasmid stabilization system protein ParE